VDTRRLAPTSRLVAAVTGVAVPRNKAVVGENAFAHEAGIHQHGMLRHQQTYEIMRPEDVGLGGSRLVLGKHSGRHAFRDRVQASAWQLDDAELDRAFIEFKALADRKKEIFDADIEALVLRSDDAGAGPWRLAALRIRSGDRPRASAEVELAHADGALPRGGGRRRPGGGGLQGDRARHRRQRRAAELRHPQRDGRRGRPGRGRGHRGHGGRIWQGKGFDTDIIQASALAFLQAVNRIASAGAPTRPPARHGLNHPTNHADIRSTPVAPQFPRYIWQNGRLVPGEQATVHVLSHALHYGSSVFEGDPRLPTPVGFALLPPARAHRAAVQLGQALPHRDSLHARGDRGGLQRGGAGQRPGQRRLHPPGGVPWLRRTRPDGARWTRRSRWPSPHRVGRLPRRRGAEERRRRVRVVLAARRAQHDSGRAKAAGGYLSSQLISMEAKRHGYAEGIGLTVDGMWARAPARTSSSSRTAGSTRRQPPARSSPASRAIRSSPWRAAGFEVHEQPIPREMLYFADEVFFTGTAAESHAGALGGPHPGRRGRRGPVTEVLQERFFGLFSGKTARRVGLAAAGARRRRAGGVGGGMSGRRAPCSRKSGTGTWSCRRPPTPRPCCTSTCTWCTR
jgi:branched-subunit amino acid aminotransferase/4-amino-4-deoxychorismate lyase